MLKKTYFFIAVLLLTFLLSSCQKNNNNVTPTGYASDEIDQPQIMYNNSIYYYWATGRDEELPDNYTKVGSVETNDNLLPPSENFSGSRLDVGQEIYANIHDADNIYVKYETGYARFSLSSTQ